MSANREHMKTKYKNILYVILFSAYPSLALLAHNITEDHIFVVIRPMIFSVLFSVAILLFCQIFYRDLTKSSIFSSIAIFFFFSFGHLLGSLQGYYVGGIEIGRVRFLGIMSLLVIISSFFGLLLSKKSIPIQLQNLILFISVILITFPISSILVSLINQRASITNRNTFLDANQEEISNYPDIYYIILDSYTRQDVLEKVFDYNNEPFIDNLRSMGFFVADCSRSNYQYTLQSLSSTLNMDYLPQLDIRLKPGDKQPEVLRELIQHSKVRTYLSQKGYKFISFANSYKGTLIPDADIYIQATGKNAVPVWSGYLNPFEEMFIKTTAGVILYRLPMGKIGEWFDKISFPYSERASTQLFMLEELPNLVNETSPKFVFFHMNIPHRPYIFQPDGKIQTDTRYFSDDGWAINKEFEIRGYTNTVTFLNREIPGVVQTIIDESEQDPIIIIQGDHGIDQDNRNKIFYAIYPKEDLGSEFYPSISSVNTYRIIFNHYFGEAYELLPDKSYASSGIVKFTLDEIIEDNPICLDE